MQRRRLLIFVASVWCITLAVALGQTPPGGAILISIDADNVIVQRVSFPPTPAVLAKDGLLVWPEGIRDQWISLPATKVSPPLADPDAAPLQLAGVSRSEWIDSPQTLALLGTPLDQLVGGEIYREVAAGGIYTPADDRTLLSGRITLRRLPSSPGDPYPQDEVTLRDRTGISAKIPFPKGKRELAWSEITSLPTEWAEGLPAGEYLLRQSSGSGNLRFKVESAERREAVLQPVAAISNVVASQQDPLYLQVAVEALLDSNGRSYPVDALDLLESASKNALPKHLEQIYQQLNDELQGKATLASDVTQDATGIAEVDAARRQIRLGQWDAAEASLAKIDLSVSPRAAGLASLYHAVVMSESSSATAMEAYQAFVDAIEVLKTAKPADQFNAHNNFANFLLSQSQDALYNAARQTASNMPTPLLIGLDQWIDANEELKQSALLAERLGRQQAAVTAANQARLNSLLADYIRLLNGGVAPKSKFARGEQLATQQAESAAKAVASADNPKNADPVSQAVAHEILARLAHRARRPQDCQLHAQAAIDLHLDSGSLAGVETAHRILALSLRREAESGERNQAESDELRAESLRHLYLSQALSEYLRKRIPQDEYGLSRAGFFARRAYVNEQLIELLIEAGKPAEALKYAELAKGRALQDYLAANDASSQAIAETEQDVEQMLADWPDDLVAIEYFLGAEKAHLFLIDSTGISAYTLVDEEGTPLSPQRLIAEVRSFLGDMDHAAQKISQAIASGRAADRKWQTQLHWLYERLLPPPVASRIEGSDSLLVAPHHVLHYLPFAALVTETDDRDLKFYQLPQPRFLIEKVDSVVEAPSLLAYHRIRSRGDQPLAQMNGFGKSSFLGQPSLPGVESDLASLRRTFGDRIGEIAEGDETDEEALKCLLQKRGGLLVGTHGQNVASAPLLSYLRCGQAKGADGLLQAGEIYSMKTRADLVILSACYSGLADQAPMQGDDLFGLQRALLQSGTSCVVTGKWDVFDRTGTVLMASLLDKLSHGEPVGESLADAQRQFMLDAREGNGIYSHPYFWAVLSVAGNDQIHFQASEKNSPQKHD
ncbi:CHAT domain-containing protein [Blastopirellula sp. JC732]|uniref:CHAT domain-containing protein n=1 Tax=Blastopirellula sediminis TaxID=2894196 RepID=A0A9X1SEH2_9BACT|nr:CHAT domain-containing protein [Blastopirellula sediminis]MCC9608014.1 CHAT domain-containing protein [Blastopirellula sediminis]MCC9627193.1 CHAT domain-containing protein [Blastopirellula sediminis]